MGAMKRFSASRWPVYGWLLLLMTAAFGLVIPWLGLYGDDWQYLYVYHLLGAGEYPNFVAVDRPFSAWVYQLFTPLLGENVSAYHVTVLLIRWLAACAFYELLRLIWPRQGRGLLMAAMLFAVFPNFRQQPLPLEFILHFTVMLCFLLSNVLMLKAVTAASRTHKFLLLVAAVVLAFSHFSVEYFVSLELLRPVLLWLYLHRISPDRQGRVKTVLAFWLPFLMVLFAFAYWRVFIYSFQFYQPAWLAALAVNPAKAIFALLWRAAGDIWLIIAGAWARPLVTTTGYQGVLTALAMLLAAVLVKVVTDKVVSTQSADSADIEADSQGRAMIEMLIVGSLALVLAGWPFWLVEVPIEAGFPWDRPSMSFMAGAALFWTALVLMFIRPRLQVWVASLLIGLALVFHYQNARTYTGEWQQVRASFQQLVWRAPQIAPDTILLTDSLPLLYYGDNTLSPALNWTYAPELHQHRIPYRVFDLGIRSDGLFATAERGMPIQHHYRSFQFEGTTDRLIAFSIVPGGCLRLIDQSNAAEVALSDRLSDYLHLSDLSLVGHEPERELPAVFGAPQNKDWCYYFEKADAAAAEQNWEAVIDWYARAEAAGMHALNPHEWLPLLKALLSAGQPDEAATLATQEFDKDDQVALCRYLLASESNAALAEAKANLNSVINCPAD